MLLNDNDPKIRVCCAVCPVGLTDCSDDKYYEAVEAVKNYTITSDGAEKTGFEYWLEEYKTRN